MVGRNVVSRATLIRACTNCGRLKEALGLDIHIHLENMEPNEVTLPNVLTACSRARDLDTGKRVRGDMIRRS
ncbi:hypothetical protein Taro_037708 [Colocasia esculenta]|uniref:Uncharacterized protein n=1 Tax=Colocasia esculenta TaxID=4460 RepID=A0A843WH17_COLES|nr:hypothetical protein [Colocasia esculenta]